MSMSSAVHVGLHAYRTDPLLPQRDGVNLAHENITRLMLDCADPRIRASFHDFTRLVADENYARDMLAPLDCVLSSVGPHAHYYFWLRERLGLDFRIVRDVRTAIWSSYLLQEHLIAPLLRDDDTLMVASNYTWAIYDHIFPGLRGHSTAICYPLTVAFPDERPAPRNPPCEGEDFVIGYLGRLSEDKNFPCLVDLVIALNRAGSGSRRYRLLACGEVYSPACQPDEIRQRIEGALGEGNWFEYFPPIDNDAIWDLLARFDCMMFPSTSNLETFGRVLIEASFARVPIVSGEHAAASELIDESGLCPVAYNEGESFSAHFDHCLGSVAVADMARALTSGMLRASPSYETYATHDQVLCDLIAAAPPRGRTPDLSPSQEAFVAGLDVALPPALSEEEAMATVELMASWFVRLQDKASAAWKPLVAELLERSTYKERTHRFISKAWASNGDFTNVGGIDIELCHIAHFYPTFRLGAQKRGSGEEGEA